MQERDESRVVVRNARLLAGLTQGEFAELAGLKQQYISLVELSMQNIALGAAEIIASASNCELWATLRPPKSPRRNG